MKFNSLVKNNLFPIIEKLGYKVVMDFKNNVQFESSEVRINIVFNNYENSHFVEIGNRDSAILYPLNDAAVKEVFNLAVPIEHVTITNFIKNLSLLFESERGKEILLGNILPLEYFIKRQSETYTSDLQIKQILNAADEAWKNGNFSDVVRYLEKANKDNLSASYKQKYKIAQKRLNN